MKTIKLSFRLFAVAAVLVSILSISCSKDDNKEAEEDKTTEFKKEDYNEYFICIADGKRFAVGNNTTISTSITTFTTAGILYINTSNGAFIPGNTASQEIIIQLKAFNKSKAQNYDLSGTYPAEVLKLNGTDGHYITNDGTMKIQSEAVKVTKIEDGFAYGTFSFTAYDEMDKTRNIKVTDGEFKFQLPD